MVPAEPATQATSALTGARPRKRAVTPVSVSAHDGLLPPPEAKPPTAASTNSPRPATAILRSDLMDRNLPDPTRIGSD
jgi:hypothetical protein